MHAGGQRVSVRSDPPTAHADAGGQHQVGFDGLVQPAAGRGRSAELVELCAEPNEVRGTDRAERPAARLPTMNGAHIHTEGLGEALLGQAGGLARQLEHVPRHDTA